MERLALDRWASPWLRNQHVARYRWSGAFAAGKRVLDAACGSGYGSRILKNAGAKLVVSADLSPEAFTEAQRGNGSAELRLVRADVAALPVESASIDLYTCFETVEHVDADRALVAEAKRVLRDGGVFLCSTPNRDLLSPGHTLRDRPRNPYHVREYSLPEFKELLRSAFGSVRIHGQTWFSEGHRSRLARAARGGGTFAVRLHQLRNILGLPWERPTRHEPVELERGTGVPEVFLAVCRA